MTQIIALAGKAGSGKDTVADMVLDHALDWFSHAGKFSFAARLKQGLAAMLDVHMDGMSRTVKEEPVPHLAALSVSITPRYLAQTLGTEWGRSIHPDLWVYLLMRDILEMDAPVAIIADCRFPNEVEAVRKAGGVVWWVERDGIAPVRAHASENAIGPQDCDRTILNLGTLDDLDETVRVAWEQLQAERAAA